MGRSSCFLPSAREGGLSQYWRSYKRSKWEVDAIRTEVDPHASGGEDAVDDPDIVHNVLGLCATQFMSDEGRGNPTYGVYEEAR